MQWEKRYLKKRKRKKKKKKEREARLKLKLLEVMNKRLVKSLLNEMLNLVAFLFVLNVHLNDGVVKVEAEEESTN